MHRFILINRLITQIKQFNNCNKIIKLLKIISNFNCKILKKLIIYFLKGEVNLDNKILINYKKSEIKPTKLKKIVLII